jgi:hypothetical protein
MIVQEEAKALKLFFLGMLVGKNLLFKAHATGPILTKWLFLLDSPKLSDLYT